MSQNLQNIAKFQKFQLENLVDFEKCCKTHIFLQKSEPIQPKTSNILPKFCRSAVVSPTGDERRPFPGLPDRRADRWAGRCRPRGRGDGRDGAAAREGYRGNTLAPPSPQPGKIHEKN